MAIRARDAARANVTEIARTPRRVQARTTGGTESRPHIGGITAAKFHRVHGFSGKFVQCADIVPTPFVGVGQIERTGLFVVRRNAARLFLGIAAGIDIIVPVIVNKTCLPQRVELFGIPAPTLPPYWFCPRSGMVPFFSVLLPA